VSCREFGADVSLSADGSFLAIGALRQDGGAYMLVSRSMLLALRRLLVTCLVLNLVLVGACTSLRPVDFERSSVLKSGDRVRVVTRSGVEQEFELTAVTPEALVGKDVQVRRDEIATLEVRRVHVGKTALLLGAVVLLVKALRDVSKGYSKIVNPPPPN
jgi:hypothetical protein